MYTVNVTHASENSSLSIGITWHLNGLLGGWWMISLLINSGLFIGVVSLHFIAHFRSSFAKALPAQKFSGLFFCLFVFFKQNKTHHQSCWAFCFGNHNAAVDFSNFVLAIPGKSWVNLIIRESVKMWSVHRAQIAGHLCPKMLTGWMWRAAYHSSSFFPWDWALFTILDLKHRQILK